MLFDIQTGAQKGKISVEVWKSDFFLLLLKK